MGAGTVRPIQTAIGCEKIVSLKTGYAYRFLYRVGDRRSRMAVHYGLDAGCLYYCEFINTKTWIGVLIRRVMSVTDKGIYVRE